MFNFFENPTGADNMVTIRANIPAIKTSGGGKTWSYPARVDVFIQDDAGRWAGSYGAMQEADVIDVCKKASNWKEIRITHFPMFGFQS